MAKYTDKQVEKVNNLANDKNVVRARKKLSLYQKNDEGMAMFRAVFMKQASELMIRHTLNKPLLKETKTYYSTWLNNPHNSIGDLFRDFVKAVEAATGRKVKV